MNLIPMGGDSQYDMLHCAKNLFSAKKIVLLVAVASISITFLTSCANHVQKNPDALHEGVTFAEYAAIVPEEERLDWLAYSFFQTRDGKTVAVEFNEHERITVKTVHVIEPAVCTEEAAEEFGKGGKLLDILAALGFPSSGEGADLQFTDANETEYVFRFDSGYNCHGYTVHEKPFHFTPSQLSRLKAGMTPAEVLTVLGGSRGSIVSGTRNPYTCVWNMDDGGKLSITFQGDENESVFYAKSGCTEDKDGNLIILF